MSTQLVRFDPWSVMRDFDRAFMTAKEGRTNAWMPRIDVFEDEGTLILRAELAGVDADSIEVTQEGRTLTLSGSRTLTTDDFTGTAHRREILEGDFERKLRLPQGIDAESITATSNDGILEVAIPLLPEVQPRKVTVTSQR
jgi:HSP20 family protein